MTRHAIRTWFCTLFALATICCALAQTPKRAIGIAYYNVDKLYDTIPSPFYNDEAYTPNGKMCWNSERYNRKIINIAAVIDSMKMPITALYGVETESVVRDIVATSALDYSYVHKTQNSFDGMDFALLYYGDLFSPKFIDSGRSYLYVEGKIRDSTVGILISNDSKFAEWMISEVRSDRPDVKLIALGRLSTTLCKKHGLINTLAHAEEVGRGNARSTKGWYMRDRALVDTAIIAYKGDVYAQRYMIDSKSSAPKPIYQKGRYIGGYGRYFPIFTYIR